MKTCHFSRAYRIKNPIRTQSARVASVLRCTALLLCAAALLVSCGKSTPQSLAEDSPPVEFTGGQAAAGKVLADLAAYRIAYYEPVLVSAAPDGDGSVDGAVVIQESDEPFTINAFGPQDELPSEVRRPSIYAVFSQPVVPLAKLGEPLTEDAGFFNITPALKGVYRWYGSKLLSFEPDMDSLPQQSYTITVSDAIKSLGGKSLTGNRTFSFKTERLSVLEWSLGGGGYWVSTYSAPPDEARYILAVFSYAVDLGEIAKWLEISGGGKTYPFTVSRPEKIERDYRTKNAVDEQFVLITMKDPPPLNTDMTVTLKAGARSQSGWLGSEKAVSYDFHTLRPFAFQSAEARGYSSPRVQQYNSIPINVSFNYNVAEANAEQFFSVNGLPALTKDNIKVYGGSVVLIDLPLEYERRYTLTIKGGLKDTLGRTLGADRTVSIDIDSANSYVSVVDSGARTLEAAYPARYAWETQNPVSISKGIMKVSSPYERPDTNSARSIDMSPIPRNKKFYFMEDLSPFLNANGKGSVGMYWNSTTTNPWNGRVQTAQTWLSIQVTDIGITTRYAYNSTLVWVTRLSTGEPIAGANVHLLNDRNIIVTKLTGADGLAVFDFADGEFISKFTAPYMTSSMRTDSLRDPRFAGQGFGIRVEEKGGADAGGDTADFIPNDSHNLWRFNVSGTISPFNAEADRPVVFLFTDRGLYKPGETVTFRGIDRTISRGVYRPYTGAYSIEASTGAYNAKPIVTIPGTATRNGGSYGSFVVPEDLDPGTYTLKYTRTQAPTSSANPFSEVITFTVANFERLRFEASLTASDEALYSGDTIAMQFSASYLAGGSLAGAPYTYFWTKDRTWFTPKGADRSWEQWRFGPENTDGSSFVSQGENTLGPDGSASITQLAAGDGIAGAPYSYRLEASAQDASRQQVSARANVIVHPAAFYLGSRLDQGTLTAIANTTNSSAWFLAAGQPATASWALVSPDGSFYNAPVGTEITAQLVRYDWKQARQAGVGGRINVSWEKVEEIIEERKIVLKENETSGVIPFTPSKSGQWEIRFSAKDEKGRDVVTRDSFYVSGAGWVQWGADDVDAITITPDKPLYAAGDTAELLVRSPLPKGKYLLTIEREGILSEKIIELDGSARTIQIPIQESYTPIVYVALSSYTVRSSPPQNTYYTPDLDKPKGIFGISELRVDTTTRRYEIEITPSKPSYRPKEQAEVKLIVKNNGKPVPNAELTFMAVDRGVIDLIDYHVPDPLAYFYDAWNFPLGVQGADSRSLLIDPVTYTLADLQGGDAESGKLGDERSDFRPLAVFEPFLVTGADGSVTVRFTMPDNLTTYRCTAVAAGVDRFGIQEAEVRVSQPLNATIAIPRKLRWRDTATVSLILTNMDAAETTANVSLTASNVDTRGLWGDALAVDGEPSQSVTLASGETKEVRFTVAAIGAGESKLSFTLESPLVQETISKTIEISRPSVFETVTTIGNLTGDRTFVEEGVVLPAFVPEGTGSLAVTVAASRLAQLKEAVQYLLTYPYGCLEQRTAAVLPLIAFGDHIAAFELESPVTNPREVINRELRTLAQSKLSSGLYPYWPGGRAADPMVSLRVAHIAILAKQKGYALPDGLDAGVILKNLQSYWIANKVFDSDPFLKGYYLWLRVLNGEKVSAEIASLVNQGDELGISGYGFAGLAAFDSGDTQKASEILARIVQFLRPGTRTVDLTDTYERKSNYWGYDADRYALALMLYASLSPTEDMTTRLATALLERQRRGVWANTASSFWAVLAFSRIADAESSEGTNFRASVTLASHPFLTADFTAYGGVPVTVSKLFTDSPVSDTLRDTLLPLRIERQGENASGSLYYTASLRYGIPAELASMRDEGVGVFSETFDVDGKPVTDGRLIAGKTYTRRITVSSSRDRTFLALRAPIPSGAEIIDATFVTSSSAPPPAETETNAENWWDWQAEPIRFIMDDEARFHWDFFTAGRQTIEFRFRAVMPGIYPVPPAQAECMYEEEIFGRSAGELARIEG